MDLVGSSSHLDLTFKEGISNSKEKLKLEEEERARKAAVN